ncbi:methyl-accepting chemotaxis protein [Glaciecola sp. XM2]|jgi:methyl-accepting chemotaxis protein|uniref:methyl-accepting chemotaxis protein n=1 Tax=Glaciecola sp. XM2 TaxID=1914931 RepID=UPI001BDF3A99|nr:methyl-accepting chemotaxis protein [Glaciecola sp. XM2]MBT1451050.1 methyl-accepting chemotaxis protein [Glaciecola sp. XM2]
MKITVALRVIAGFAVISFLLLLLGFSSMSSLDNVGDASNEVSTLALPTVAGTSNLKVAFLNMGRLSFEGFVSDQKDQVEAKQEEFNASKARFIETLTALNEVVKEDKALSEAVANVNSLYESYVDTSSKMFTAHLSAIELNTSINEMVSSLEENADDASSYLLDFTDLDEISDSDSLTEAAEVANNVESNLLSLLSVASDYGKTQSMQRAEIRSKEVAVVLEQTQARFAQMVDAANGEDESGTIDEVAELIAQIAETLNATDGLLNTKINELQQISISNDSLLASDQKITEAIIELDALNAIADTKAAEIKESVDSQIATSTATIIIVVIISFGLAGWVGYVTVNAITRPLARVNELLKIASSGDLTHRLDDSASDEFGTLAKNCNTLIDNLKELINAINQRADQLAAASGETSTITLETTTSIEEQKSQISQIAAATTEMHTTSELVSSSAKDTLLEIKHADAEAEKVKKISAENKDTIEVLAREVQEAAEVINKLHQDSASIGGILDVIRGVADQTNLLALNAAIEAARAGEYGRGFAVVADEVRTLASRTQQSTQEINSMIEVLQAGAEKAVTVMNQGKEQTNACVAQTEKAGAALNLITDAVHKAYEVSTRIEEAAREQHTVSSQISERLENIVGIAEHTTVGAKQTSESSAEVAKLAEELQASISQFRV